MWVSAFAVLLPTVRGNTALGRHQWTRTSYARSRRTSRACGAMPDSWCRISISPTTWCRAAWSAPFPTSTATARTATFAAGLFTILLNVVRSYARKAHSHRWEPIDDHLDGLHSAPRQIDALRLRDLRRAFARLPDSFQEVIVLVAIEGMAYEEAARVLEVPLGTVRSRLSRARRQLEAVMDGAEPRSAA